MKQHQYQIRLTHLHDEKGQSVAEQSIEFNAPNHDDLFAILDKFRQAQPQLDKEVAYRFIIGLKMMSEVVLENRNDDYFAQFSPLIKEMMMIVKGKKAVDKQ